MQEKGWSRLAKMSATKRIVEAGGYRVLHWAAVFLLIAVIAAMLGFGAIAGVSLNFAWLLFVVGLIAAIVFFLLGRRSLG
jgi:uncharacterized membrane protein YtjA (UPF0391 family)